MDELARWRCRGVELTQRSQRLLRDLTADGFTWYRCGPKTHPAALVAAYEWEDYVDVVTIRASAVVTARVPTQHGKVDVLAPKLVVWHCEGVAEPTLHILLELVHPHHPDAPTTPYPAPRSLQVPRHEQRPMTIRLPSPGRAGTRATRLAARHVPHEQEP